MTLSDAWVDSLAGWCSGAAAVVCVQPVDTVLTRLQAGTSLVVGQASARGFMQTSGYTALWRGASPMIGAVPIQNALLMGGYGVGQQYAAMHAPEHKNIAVFVGGCTGGVLQSFIMSPVELVKVTQQCAGRTMRQAAQDLVHSQAWRGLGATLLRDGLPHGVWFWTYEVSKEQMLTSSLNMKDPSFEQVLVPLVSGAWAATVAWAVGYPADLIKTRIQAGSQLGIFGTASDLMKEGGGMSGLYRGFGLKLVRSVPASMIGFTVYEFVKKQVLENL